MLEVQLQPAQERHQTPWSPLGTVLWTAAALLLVLALVNLVQGGDRAPAQAPTTTQPVEGTP